MLGTDTVKQNKSLSQLQTEKITKVDDLIQARMKNYDKTVLMPEIHKVHEKIEKEQNSIETFNQRIQRQERL